MPLDFEDDEWAALSSLLDEVLELPTDERQAWLGALARRSPERHASLLRLLAADRGASEAGFLESPAAIRAVDDDARDIEKGALPHEGDTTARTTGAPPADTRRIGPYRLLQQLGEGGMGEVWLAEQATPVRRRVALKLIKPGMDTREVIARFEAERQALAVMDHPDDRQGVRRRRDGGRPAVLRHGVRRGRADHRLLRSAAARHDRAARALPAGVRRRSSTRTRRGSSTAT